MNILLVEPAFPIPCKSRYHKDFLPIGLLKLASYHRSKKQRVALVRGKKRREEIGCYPDQILVTSLFTYWRKYVKETVAHYRKLFPRSKIIVGGIYGSLMPEDCVKFTKCDRVFKGIHKKAERFAPAYDLLAGSKGIDYQIIHTSRGCIRDCKFCGAKVIEPEHTFKKSIKHEICSRHLVFYDNNLLANPYIEDIFNEIADSRFNGRPISCESQCGFDGRLLTPKLARLIKKARFRDPKIAWDGPYSQWEEVQRQLHLLIDAGYRSKRISVFMLHNWELDFKEMERKRRKCFEWRVQISDCRFRPLDQRYDNYNPKKTQTNDDYYIHPKWTDKLVKQFRKNVRRQNICVRMNLKHYSVKLEARGRRDRRIRKRVAEQLQKMGYEIFKVRQIAEEKGGWTANVRIGKDMYVVELTSSYHIHSISKDEQNSEPSRESYLTLAK